ncbi:pirin family protein [bacterium]|nr:MAG: pirin family protein [bacterium]
MHATPTFAIQRASERYFADHGWLKTYHSFSFADYVDPDNLNWGALRVLNDDTIAAGTGFPLHPHRDMEIVTYVIDGQLEHRDSMGNRGIVGPGSVQFMSAGTGVRHSEFNASKQHSLRLVQMWVLPGKTGTAPLYGQADFTVDDRRDRWLTIASGVEGVEAPVHLTQRAVFAVARLEEAQVEHRFSPGRLGFLFAAEGNVEANGAPLAAGDSVRIADLDRLTVGGRGEILLWDVPPTA